MTRAGEEYGWLAKGVKSWSEIQLWVHYRPLCTINDRSILLAGGLIDGSDILTELGSERFSEDEKASPFRSA